MRPPATMGVECVSVPSCTVHLMFLPVLGSKESGRSFSSDTMLRDQACPHCGWSAAEARKIPAPTTRPQPSNQLQIPNCPRQGRQLEVRQNKAHRTQIQLRFMGECHREMSACLSTRNL